ncbi:MAG: hypothetical protein QF473_41220, partial [Planctomycetota bacterium]|nr:hypothetical protein [Planctomycetota bacterium]
GARTDLTRRPNVYANPYFKPFRDAIVKQFRKFAEIGADGIHIDKLAWFNPNLSLDFNPALETSPDRANTEGILLAMREAFDACREINPDFGISFEGAWDRMLEFCNVVWLWQQTGSRHQASPIKFTFPQWLPTQQVVQPFDYHAVNNAVRYGYQIFAGPGDFSRSMQDPPMQPL